MSHEIQDDGLHTGKKTRWPQKVFEHLQYGTIQMYEFHCINY